MASSEDDPTQHDQGFRMIGSRVVPTNDTPESAAAWRADMVAADDDRATVAANTAAHERGDHDERRDDECASCIIEADERGAYFRPSKGERAAESAYQDWRIADDLTVTVGLSNEGEL